MTVDIALHTLFGRLSPFCKRCEHGKVAVIVDVEVGDASSSDGRAFPLALAYGRLCYHPGLPFSGINCLAEARSGVLSLRSLRVACSRVRTWMTFCLSLRWWVGGCITNTASAPQENRSSRSCSVSEGRIMHLALVVLLDLSKRPRESAHRCREAITGLHVSRPCNPPRIIR